MPDTNPVPNKQNRNSVQTRNKTKEKKVLVSVSLTPSQLFKLERIAEFQTRTKAGLIREAIDLYLDTYFPVLPTDNLPTNKEPNDFTF